MYDNIGAKIAAVVIAVLLVIGAIIFFASTTIVPTGHIGVVTLYSKVQDKYLDAGFHFVRPFVESVHDVDIRTQKYSNIIYYLFQYKVQYLLNEYIYCHI